MKFIDVNILLYAVNQDDPRHERILRWWEGALVDEEPVAVCWEVLVGFLRVATNPKATPHPIPMTEAIAQVEVWLSHPNVQIIEESADHWTTLRRLVRELGATGNLVTDAHLAALAIQNGCTLASCDADFGRFPGLRWLNPLFV